MAVCAAGSGLCAGSQTGATLNAFSYHPSYYHFEEETTNYFDFGMQNSRGFRALKVWTALRQAGRDGYLKMIGDDIRLAKYLHSLAAAHPELEALSCGLSITTFRYVPPDLRQLVGSAETEEYLNRLNTDILSRIEIGGEAFLSNTVIDGKVRAAGLHCEFSNVARGRGSPS